MDNNAWKYYKHALIPTTPPHEAVDTTLLEDGTVWKKHKNVLLVRWSSDFDCKNETQWWYVIKDTPFDINAVKAKRRYEINKGKKAFDIRTIDPFKYADALFDVTSAAYSEWPKKYRPTLERERFISSIGNWDYYMTLGAFDRNENKLCGYALLSKQDNCINFNVLRVRPECERNGINAAIVADILERHFELLNSGGYVCDGARNINHETAFQDYLEKYFGFRKAYCKLNISYRPLFALAVKTLFPLKNLLLKFDGVGAIHQINSILKMENIRREGMEHI